MIQNGFYLFALNESRIPNIVWVRNDKAMFIDGYETSVSANSYLLTRLDDELGKSTYLHMLRGKLANALATITPQNIQSRLDAHHQQEGAYILAAELLRKRVADLEQYGQFLNLTVTVT